MPSESGEMPSRDRSSKYLQSLYLAFTHGPGAGRRAQRGFSLVELMIIAVLFVILSALAVPSILGLTRDLRTGGDVRGISTQLALARMLAASNGTKSRLNFNLAANSYQVEVWSSSTAAYQLQGSAISLAQGDTFGYGTIATPAGQQTIIAQTSPIYFNSRSLATDSAGAATASSAIYLTNSSGQCYAIAVSIAGQPTAYKFNGSSWAAY
jgi:Tfp pilus assembly protein FimT